MPLSLRLRASRGRFVSLACRGASTAMLAGLLLSSACTKKEAEATTAPSSVPVVASAKPPPGPRPPTTPAASGSGVITNGGAGDVGALFGRMGYEKAHRPAVTPNGDAAFAAFEKAKLPFIEKKQSLGTTYKASYCEFALTPAREVSILVCEYEDPASAAIGLETSNKTLANLTRRKSWAHKSLMMSLMAEDPASPPAALALIDKYVAAFNAL